MSDILMIRRYANGWVSTPGLTSFIDLSTFCRTPEKLAEQVKAWAEAQVEKDRVS